ncbi:MAG: NAD(P)-dependent oxidoreductase [Silvibacterium sp.]|nr:NAD(P)-dependent oxidoreductase [Silvibacterium sp.]MBV8632339.1 NAD(P)-dependent oxidoreductase [Silvibacterium sp.]
MNIGFVGMGKMGTGMARNLIRAGHQLTVYNRTHKKAEALAADGAQVADSPAEAARNAEAVFTMLSDDAAVAEVTFGDEGIATKLKEGAAHISSSTISTSFARHMAEEHGKRKQVLVSAPVFGRPEAAEAKRLLVVPAGEPKAVERLRPLFDAIGRETFVIGTEPWQANAAKLCGNFMIASVLESFGEAFAVIRKSGVDHHIFHAVMKELFGSPVYANYGGIIADEKFEPAGFALSLGFKDVRLAIEAGQEAAAPMPFASVLRDHLVSAIANGQEDMDWSSIALVSARNAGLKADKG